MSKPEPVRLPLTEEQKAIVKAATKRNDAEALELTVQELEERIAPLRI